MMAFSSERADRSERGSNTTYMVADFMPLYTLHLQVDRKSLRPIAPIGRMVLPLRRSQGEAVPAAARWWQTSFRPHVFVDCLSYRAWHFRRRLIEASNR